MKFDPVRFIIKQFRKRQLESAKIQFLLGDDDPIQKKGEIISKEAFNGGPLRDFSLIGRLYLITLLKIGLTPDSKVLDIGCGALRGGYWLIHFLNPNRFFGIEPNKEMLEVGKRTLFDPETLKYKSPSFDTNEDFNFSVFNEKFDFIVARSVWTHTSKAQIQKMLDEFVKNSNPMGVFLASYLKPFHSKDDYKGKKWIGRSHDSNEAGVVFHKFSWIKEECDIRKLSVQELKFDYVSQVWLHISKL